MWLLFQMNLKSSERLLRGTLEVRDGENKTIAKYSATSGARQSQTAPAQSKVAKGPIPSSSVSGLNFYRVKTVPYDRLETKGIRGPFFHILPNAIKVRGVVRSEFGIHFDADAPGSAGCIVLLKREEWIAFAKFMRDYASKHSHISLVVEYS